MPDVKTEKTETRVPAEPPRAHQPPVATPSGAVATAPEAAQPRRRRRWLRRVLLFVAPVVAVAVGGYVYFTGGRYVGTDNAYVKSDKVMIAAEVSGPIATVAVEENEHVEAGDVLFTIDDRPYRIALDEAQAHVASVYDQVAGLKAGYLQKQEELALAQADLEYAQSEFDREQRLVASNAVSRSDFDAAQHDLNVAQLKIRMVQQELAQLSAELGGDPDAPVESNPDYRTAQAAVDRAALDLERTIVKAPFAGIASNTPEVGEQVASGASPVMSIVADSDVWIEANFRETDLTHVVPGQTVSIQVDTYPDVEWHGTVESIAPATGAEFSIIPPQNASGNWVKVVQRIPVRIAVAADGDTPPLRAGMSTVVEIDTGYERPMPEILQTALAWVGAGPTALAAEAGAEQ